MNIEQNGFTPLIELKETGMGIYGKVEFLHPTASIKHRSIPAFLAEQVATRMLHRGTHVIVQSAGCAAITTAWAAVNLGLKAEAIVPQTTSLATIHTLHWLGARCHPLPSREANDRIRLLQQEHPSFYLDQFSQSELISHYRPIASEIIKQLPSVQAVCIGIGTGISITGIAQLCKQIVPHCQIIGVEPVEAAISLGKSWSPHKISGLAPPLPRPLLDLSLVDQIIPVESTAAWVRARMLAQTCGLLVGPSSGATVEAALKWRAQHKGDVVALLSSSIFPHLEEKSLAIVS